MLAKEIINILEKHCPLTLQEEWDRSGLQIGNPSQQIHKIMISLNADVPTLNECIEEGCDMLITHHPFLLDKIDVINPENFMGKFIYKTIQNNIVVYSSHTPLDYTYMNQWLMEALKPDHIEVFDDMSMCRIGTFKPMNLDAFIEHIKNSYNLEHFKYAGNKDHISKVAICGGSAADFMPGLIGRVDAFITGDTKYRHAKNAEDYGMVLVDINHHAENIMVNNLKELLQQEIDIEIVTGSSKDYYHYI